MGCLNLTYQTTESPLKAVYRKSSFEQNNVQRLLRQDPLASKAMDWTPYRYAFNNPVKFIDPDGMLEAGVTHASRSGNSTQGDMSDMGSFEAADESSNHGKSSEFETMEGAIASLQTDGDGKSSGGGLQTMADAGAFSLGEGARNGMDLSSSGIALGTGGLLYGLAENVVTPGNQWLGKNGKYYSNTWGGNGATGSRSGAFSASRAYKLAGKASFFLGAGISLMDGFGHLRSRNYIGASKSGVDIGFGAIGTYGGPFGFAASAVYFGMDATIGWGNAYRSLDNITKQNQSILGPSWSPSRIEGGNK